jgi:epoxide hydrolase-like predicted phosphatase
MAKMNTVKTNAKKTSKIKWLLVDIGDVLLARNEDNSKTFNELLVDELNVDIELAKEINKAHYSIMDIKYIPEEEFVANLKRDLGYDAPQDIFAYFARAYSKQRRPNTQFLNFLHEIRLSGIKTAVLSNTIAIYTPAHASAGISKEGGFEPIIYSWQVELAKPQKEIFKLALNELKVEPEDIIFIDDKPEHIKGAASFGMHTILFEDTNKTIAQILQLVN